MKAVLTECDRRLGHAIAQFPWTDRRAYAEWLAQTYYYVRHSTRLLAAAAARFAFGKRDAAFHQRFSAHMGEEKNHEILCVQDLKCLGFNLEEIRERSSVRMLYEPQYYKIEHQGPIALFGYILPLEVVGPSSGKKLLEPLARAHGDKSVSFLKLHAAEDVRHLDKALELLDGLAEPERELIEQNMWQTTYAYGGMLEDIRRRLGLVAPEPQQP
jgi:hypothetical protein